MRTATVSLKDRLLNARSLPRWIIFTLDLGCSAFALGIAFLLRFNFDLVDIGQYPFFEFLGIVLCLNCIFFYFFKVYSGIIRQTSLEDARKVLSATLLSTIVLFAWNLFAKFGDWSFFLPASITVIYFFTCAIFLFGYRLFIKAVFEYLSNGGMRHTNVIIMGANEAGLITLEALQKSQSNNGKGEKINVIAFLDNNSSLWKKQLQGIPILPLNGPELIKLHKRRRIRQLIISEEIGMTKERDQLMNWCLENRIKIRHIPPVFEWLQDDLQVRQIRDIRIEDLLNRDVIDIHNKQVESAIKDKVLLITGAAGSIGSELVRQIGRYHPKKVILCDQAESPLHELWLEVQKLFPQSSMVCYLADTQNKAQLAKMFRQHQPDWVLHAAAYKHVPMMERCPEMAILNNVMSTIYLAELSVKFNVEKFVMISTDKAVNPTNIMGASKRLAEIFTQSYNTHLHHQSANGNGNGNGQVRHTSFITTRFGNVLGSNGSVVPLFTRQISEGGPVTVTHPNVVRYFMTIPEACQLVLEAAIMGNGGEIFVFDMGQPVKISDMARKMIQLTGLVPDIDVKIKYTGLRPGEKLYEELLANDENTLATHHPKIMIAKVREYPFELIKNQLQYLIALASDGHGWEVVRVMKQVIPEFRSNNSSYEELDLENKKQSNGNGVRMLEQEKL